MGVPGCRCCLVNASDRGESAATALDNGAARRNCAIPRYSRKLASTRHAAKRGDAGAGALQDASAMRLSIGLKFVAAYLRARRYDHVEARARLVVTQQRWLAELRDDLIRDSMFYRPYANEPWDAW